MRRKATFWGALLLLAVVGLSGCGDQQQTTSALGLQQRVPADAPYAYVAERAMPDSLRGKLGAYYARQMSTQRATLQKLREQLAASPEAAPMLAEHPHFFAVLDAFFAEFEGRDSVQQLNELGINPVPRSMIYGLGLLPVAWVEIADRQKLEAMLDRVEAKAGVSANRAEYEGRSYRRIDFGEIDVLIAVTDQFAIIAAIPQSLFESQLPIVLGKQTPKTSLADSGVLDEIRERHGLTDYGAGFVKLDTLLDIFLGRAQGLNAEVAKAMGETAVPMSQGCLNTTRGIVAGMPRMVLGITEADETTMAMRGVWESVPAVSEYLQRLAAPVPGIGAEYDALMTVGIGLNLPQLRNAIEAFLNSLIASGSDCEWIDPAELQAVVPQLNLVLGPMTGGIRGFNLIIEDVDIDDQSLELRQARGALLAAVDDPRGMFALGAMFNPALAALQIPQDGTFVDLPQDLGLQAQTPPMKVAMKDKALILLAGSGMEQLGEKLLTAVPAQPAPLFTMDYGLRLLVERFTKLGELAATRIEQQGDQASMDTAMGLREQLESFRIQSELVDRVHVTVRASDAGLIMEQNYRVHQ